MRGLPLARLGHLHRLSDGGARSPTGRRRPFPGKHHPDSGPSHRHRSDRNHRRRGAGSSPALGYWPDEAREHAHSPQSRGSPDQSALPAINRSRAPRPRGPAPRLRSPTPPTCPLPFPSLGPAPSQPGAPPLLLLLSPSAAGGFSSRADRDFERFVRPVRLPLPSSRENWRFASIKSARPKGPAGLRD